MPTLENHLVAVSHQRAMTVSSDYNRDVVVALRKLGCLFIATKSEDDTALLDALHKDVSTYSGKFTPLVMLNVLEQLSKSESLVSMCNRLFSMDDKRAIRRFIAGAGTLPPEVKNVVMSLLILEKLTTSDPVFVHAAGSSYFAVRDQDRIHRSCYHTNLLSCDRSKEQWMFDYMGVAFMDEAKYHRTYTFSMTSSLKLQDRNDVYMSIINNLPSLLLQDKTFAEAISQVAFVPVSEDLVRSPCGLFDPEISEIRTLYPTEHVFPVAPFSDRNTLVTLRRLGMRGALLATDVVERVTFICNEVIKLQGEYVSATDDEAKRAILERCTAIRVMSTTLLAYLDRIFDKWISGHLLSDVKLPGDLTVDEFLSQICTKNWLPALPMPKSYQLSWKANDPGMHANLVFCSIYESRLSKDKNLVSSVMHIIDAEIHSNSLKTAMGLCGPPDYSRVVSHLKNMIKEHSCDTVVDDKGEMIDKSAPTVQEAIALAMTDLKCAPEEVKVTVIDAGCVAESAVTKTMFGKKKTTEVQKARPARVRVSKLGVMERKINDTNDITLSIYDYLCNSMEGLDWESLQAELSEMTWVWVGDVFVKPKQLSFTPMVVNMRPWLYEVPSQIKKYSALLIKFNARAAFTWEDFVWVLERIKVVAEERSKVNAVITDQELTMASTILLTLSQDDTFILPKNEITGSLKTGGILLTRKEVLVPTKAMTLALARAVAYDERLRSEDGERNKIVESGLHLLHPSISIPVAAALGVRSLNYLLQDENATDLDLGYTFGQREDFCARLANILRDYPSGDGLFKELLQNSDDCGATDVAFIYDKRSFKTDSLFAESMALCQTPALLSYNNVTMSQEDVKNIQALGNSRKKSEAYSTGRFGLGFNSVYHVTDLPSFVTGDSVYFMDPHVSHVPNATATHPGRGYNLLRNNFYKQFPDQFEPYNMPCVGCTVGKRFDGTLFRFPLRTPEGASESKIKPIATQDIDVTSLINHFAEQAPSMMLFLKNVRNLNMYVWERDAPEPTLIKNVVVELDKDAKKDASSILMMTKKKNFFEILSNSNNDDVQVEYFMKIISKSRTVERIETWLISQRLSCSSESDIRRLAIDKEVRDAGLKFVPWGGVAALVQRNQHVFIEDDALNKPKTAQPDAVDVDDWCVISPTVEDAKKLGLSSSDRDEWWKLNVKGRAYCFLPLPVDTSLPCHIHGYFELGTSRRDLFSGDDVSGIDRLRVKWNELMLTDVIAPAYAKLLDKASDYISETYGSKKEDRLSYHIEKYYDLFPLSTAPGVSALVRKLVTTFYNIIMHDKVFRLKTGKWVSCADGVFDDKCYEVARTAQRWKLLSDYLTRMREKHHADDQGPPLIVDDYVMKSEAANRWDMLRLNLKNAIAAVRDDHILVKVTTLAKPSGRKAVHELTLEEMFMVDGIPLLDAPMKLYNEFLIAGAYAIKITPLYARIYYCNKMKSINPSTDDDDVIDYDSAPGSLKCERNVLQLMEFVMSVGSGNPMMGTVTDADRASHLPGAYFADPSEWHYFPIPLASHNLGFVTSREVIVVDDFKDLMLLPYGRHRILFSRVKEKMPFILQDTIAAALRLIKFDIQVLSNYMKYALPSSFIIADVEEETTEAQEPESDSDDDEDVQEEDKPDEEVKKEPKKEKKSKDDQDKKKEKPSKKSKITRAVKWSPPEEYDPKRRKPKHPTREWVKLFWSYVTLSNVRSLEFINRWAVLPTADGRMYGLAFAKTCVLPYVSSDAAVIQLLIRAGIAVIDPAYNVPTFLFESLTGSSVIRAIGAESVNGKYGFNVKKFAAEEKDEMLMFFSRTPNYNESEKTVLKGLRLYELESNSDQRGKYVNLKKGKCYVLPPDITCSPEGNVFLVFKPAVWKLYEGLGVSELKRSEFFTLYVLPKFDKLTTEARWYYLERIRLSLAMLMGEDPEFTKVLSAIPFVTTADYEMSHPNPYGSESSPQSQQLRSDKRAAVSMPARTSCGFIQSMANKYLNKKNMRCPEELFDPEITQLKAMFPNEWFPGPTFCTRQWLPVLRELGLIRQINGRLCSVVYVIDVVTTFVKQAKRVPAHNTIEVKSLSIALLSYFASNWREFKEQNASVFNELKEIAFVPVHQHLSDNDILPGVKKSTKLYAKFKEIVAPEDYIVSYTSCNTIPFTSIDRNGVCGPCVQMSRDFMCEMMMIVPVSIVTVIKHVSEVFPKEDVSGASSSRSWDMNAFGDIYELMSMAVLSHLDSLHSNSPKLLAELRGDLPSYSFVFNRTASGSMMVQPCQLAFDLTESLEPFLYRPSRDLWRFKSVLCSLNSYAEVTPKLLMDILAQVCVTNMSGVYNSYLNRKDKDTNPLCVIGPLTDMYRNTARNAQRMLAYLCDDLEDDDMHRLRTELFALDIKGYMLPVSQLVLYNDCSWMNERLDTSALHLVDLPVNLGLKVGVVPLSHLIREVAERDKPVVVVETAAVKLMNNIITTNEFKEGVYRLVCHGTFSNFSEAKIMASFETIVEKLPARVTMCQVLRSSLMFTPTCMCHVIAMSYIGTDITKSHEGSECYTASDRDGVLCTYVRNCADWQAAYIISNEMNKLIGYVITNTSPLEKLLLCDSPSQLSIILDEMHIAALDRGLIAPPTYENSASTLFDDRKGKNKADE